MRFGFKTSPQNTTWDAVLEVWRAADDMDVFESGWVSDHFYPMHTGDLSGPRLEGWITLTALAQATRRLRLGTLVTGIHYRHPAVLANMAATLDVVSGGRLELGVGEAGTSRSLAPTASSLALPASAVTGSRRRARSSLASSRHRRPPPSRAAITR